MKLAMHYIDIQARPDTHYCPKFDIILELDEESIEFHIRDTEAIREAAIQTSILQTRTVTGSEVVCLKWMVDLYLAAR